MSHTYTSDAATMRAIHAYNRAHYRQTDVQRRSPATDAWLGCVLVDADGRKWTVRIANGDTYDVPPSDIRMSQA